MKLQLVALTILAGSLLSLAWLGVSGIVLGIAFVPLFYLDDYFVKRKNENTPLVFWCYALFAFLIWNALTTWWIAYATVAGAIFAIVVNAFLMSLVMLLVHIAHRIKGRGFAGIFFIFSWLSFEYLHFNWELSWPWLTLGNGLANDIYIIQWYENTGVFGGSLWLILIDLLVWNLLKKQLISSEKINWLQWFTFMLLVLAPVVLSLLRYEKYVEKSDPVNVVVAQLNIDPYHDKFKQMSPYQQYLRLLDVCDSLGDATVDFFVGPETALHSVWQNNIEKSGAIRMVRNFLQSKYPDAAFVVGAMTYKKYTSLNPPTSTARFNTDRTFIYDAYNSALFINTDDSVQMYHKQKLVSGVEKMPFRKYLRFLDKLVINLGGTTGELATQNEPVVFYKGASAVAVPICYESGYGAYVSEFINKGANLIFIITNDGWWRDSPGYKQHLSYSRIQAIQFRRSVARSANTGISCFINQKGEIEKRTSWWRQTALKGYMNRNDDVTFYAQHGDYIARISVFMFILMGLSLITAKMKRY